MGLNGVEGKSAKLPINMKNGKNFHFLYGKLGPNMSCIESRRDTNHHWTAQTSRSTLSKQSIMMILLLLLPMIMTCNGFVVHPLPFAPDNHASSSKRESRNAAGGAGTSRRYQGSYPSPSVRLVFFRLDLLWNSATSRLYLSQIDDIDLPQPNMPLTIDTHETYLDPCFARLKRWSDQRLNRLADFAALRS